MQVVAHAMQLSGEFDILLRLRASVFVLSCSALTCIRVAAERCPSPAADNLCIITNQHSAVGVHGRC
jgi:hypothetical protein